MRSETGHAGLRVLVAPDKFAGTLDAAAAAEAIAAGWRRAAPADSIDTLPLSDGGPGFVHVLESAIGGEAHSVPVTGPTGEPTTADVLRHGDTVYIEAAQACGLHRIPRQTAPDPGTTTSYGVGEAIAAALEHHPRRVVVGLGGSATNDGGAGMLAALGAQPEHPLRRGGGAVGEPSRIDLDRPRTRTAGVTLVAATDVDNPLLGPNGATTVYAPQKGAEAADIPVLEAALTRWAQRTDRAAADRPGAGAAGGLGHALYLLGATRRPGIDAVADAFRLTDRIAAAELVLTGEGTFDEQSLHGKVVGGVARAVADAFVPCVVLAGQVQVTTDAMNAAGIVAAHSMTDSAASTHIAKQQPHRVLAALAARTAGTWHG